MEAWIIGAIILLGLALIFLEIFFIPGTTLFGVAGGVALVIGVALVYSYFGTTWGNYTLLSTSVAVGVAVIAGFKVIQSNKLAMKAEVNSRVNELDTKLKPGDHGKAITVLRPNGKASFGTEKTEVFSTGDYIERETPIVITDISSGKIFVKPLNS